MSKINFFFIFLIFFACKEDITTLAEYSNYPVKYAKTKISYPTNEFSITIPKNWKWSVEEYENVPIILGMDIGETDSITNYTRIISIHKYKSLDNNNDLRAEFESMLKISEKNSLIPEIIESGKTTILNYDAYFIHSKSRNESSIEMISFILKSKENGIFYSIAASSHIEDNIKKNLSMMINCIRSFELN